MLPLPVKVRLPPTIYTSNPDIFNKKGKKGKIRKIERMWITQNGR